MRNRTLPVIETPGRDGLAGRLFDLIQAPLRWQLLACALDLGLFDRLDPPATAADLADPLGLDATRLGRVLDGLAAMGLLDKTHGRYGLTAEAAPLLRADGAGSMRDLLLTLPRLRHGDVAGLLKDPGPVPAPDMASPGFWDGSANSLRAFHRAMGADTALDLLARLPEWPSARRLLDLGAGSEVLACRLADRHPQLDITVFDLPPMADRIRARLNGRPVTVIAGDMNDTGFGAGYDIVWTSMTLYYARDLAGVLARIRRALAPGGVFVTLHEALTAERTAPETHVTGRLVPALRGQDRSFDDGAIAAAMAGAGFTRIDSRLVETAFGPFRMDCGRG